MASMTTSCEPALVGYILVQKTMPLTTNSDDVYYNSLITAGQIHGLMLCGLNPSCIACFINPIN